MRMFSRSRIVIIVCALALLAGAAALWQGVARPTRVGMVKFQDFQVAEVMDSRESRFVQVRTLDMDDLTRRRLARFDVLYFFGRGLNFTPEQQAAVEAAQRRGTRVFVVAATTPESDLTDLRGDDLQRVRGYFENGGRQNFRALLNYSRRVLHGRTLFTQPIEEPRPVPLNTLFHLADDAIFPTVDAYQAFYESTGRYNPGAHRVALLTSLIGPRNAERAHVNALIEALEEAGHNVYPVAGFLERLAYLDAISPDLIVYFPHGRLAPGRGDEMRAWLLEHRTPVLTPMEILQPIEEWETGQQGLEGGILTQNIVMPELDGAIEPFVVSGLAPNDRGLQVFHPVPSRIDTFVHRVNRWLTLREKPNAEKRIAVVYLKGPGENAMVASGMEVAASLLALLRELKANGYHTGPLPETVEAFEARINAEGPVLGPYARGAFDRFLETGNPEWISAEEYLLWCQRHLEPSMYAAIEAEYGPAPGDWLSIMRDEEPYLAIPRVVFGNVALVPQLLPALGEDTGQIVHGVEEPPTHPYVASYLWIREGFQADALLHFGTHGSLEFTPNRQTALSSFDWPDALVGDLPHLYVYIINNIGEAIIAKRRSYAAVVSHLTPPFANAELYGPLVTLQEAATAYLGTEDPEIRRLLAEAIVEGLTDTGLYEDLDLPWPPGEALDDAMVDRIHNYLFTVAQEKITIGLYTLGQGYAPEHAVETVRLMHVDTIANARAALDIANDLAEPGILRRESAFAEQYREPAFELIDAILAGAMQPEDAVSPNDRARLAAWDEANPTMTDDELFAGFLAMSGGITAHDQGPLTELETARLDELAIAAAANPDMRSFLETLADDLSFQRTEVVLRPGGLERAQRIARVIPAMREAMDRLAEPTTLELITLMHRPGGRERVLGLIQDETQQEAIAQRLAEATARQVGVAVRPPFVATLQAAADLSGFADAIASWDEERLDQARRSLSFYAAHADLAEAIAAHDAPNAATVSTLLQDAGAFLPQAIAAIDERLAEHAEEEAAYIEEVRTLVETLEQVRPSLTALTESAGLELRGVLAGLDGQHIEPSPGGDPVINPRSVPTGRNLYAIDAERTPSPQAWQLGHEAAERLIAQRIAETGAPPEKVALTLWGGDFIKTQGLELAVVFALLGCEPVRNARGIVHDVRLIPIEELGRPRTDVVVQTSGQFRDVAASRIFLINRAVELAANANDQAVRNPVAIGSAAAEERMKARGLSPLDARTFAHARVFGGVNGNYGTGIMGLVESGDRWEDVDELAGQYIQNMGAIYADGHWGHYLPGAFEAALLNADTILQPQASNVDGALSLDHVYEFMGGLSAAITQVTGETPRGYLHDMRSGTRTQLVPVEQAIWTEARATMLNPRFIEGLQDGGSSSAEVFAETFRNTFGWNALRPEAIAPALWDNYHEVYIDDLHGLGMEAYFRGTNPYAYQEMTAVMLESVRKEFWEPEDAVVQQIAELHASLVSDHDPGCSGFVCDNAELRQFITANLSPEAEIAYNDAIDQVRIGQARDSIEGMRLERQSEVFDRLTEAIRENQASIFITVGLLALFTAALWLGARRRRTV